ncbi:MAG: hypothetical protein Q9224_007087, partial [Gallowayella concinna]
RNDPSLGGPSGGGSIRHQDSQDIKTDTSEHPGTQDPPQHPPLPCKPSPGGSPHLSASPDLSKSSSAAPRTSDKPSSPGDISNSDGIDANSPNIVNGIHFPIYHPKTSNTIPSLGSPFSSDEPHYHPRLGLNLADHPPNPTIQASRRLHAVLGIPALDDASALSKEEIDDIFYEAEKEEEEELADRVEGSGVQALAEEKNGAGMDSFFLERASVD